jgi:hypothetical protein
VKFFRGRFVTAAADAAPISGCKLLRRPGPLVNEKRAGAPTSPSRPPRVLPYISARVNILQAFGVEGWQNGDEGLQHLP